MKKFIVFFITALVCAFTVAQERTVTLSALKSNVYYTEYNGKAADTITATNQDTIDYLIKYANPEYVLKVALKVGVDTIAGADTLTVQLLGYDFLDDTSANTIIAASTTNLASTADIVLADDYMSGADEFSFRYYRIRLIRIGSGSGIKVRDVEFKTYVE